MSKSCSQKNAEIPGLSHGPWDSSPMQSQNFWLSKNRPMGKKWLGLLGLAGKSLGQSRDLSFLIQVPGTKILKTGSLVPCPSLFLTRIGWDQGWVWDGTASPKDFCPRDWSPKAQNPRTFPTIFVLVSRVPGICVPWDDFGTARILGTTSHSSSRICHGKSQPKSQLWFLTVIHLRLTNTKKI